MNKGMVRRKTHKILAVPVLMLSPPGPLADRASMAGYGRALLAFFLFFFSWAGDVKPGDWTVAGWNVECRTC